MTLVGSGAALYRSGHASDAKIRHERTSTMKAVPAAPGANLRYEPIPLDEIRAAQQRTAGTVIRSPLLRLDVEDAPANIWLKLEVLQPIRSFKLRGAYNAMAAAGREALADGVWTASAGNMAQGVAWAARELGVSCTVIVPDTAPETKIAAVRRYGGEVLTVSVEEWMQIFRTRQREGMTGVFVHPYSDPLVMAGNAVIGLEIVEDLPEVDAVIVPWGGGGLCCGIASAIRALAPNCKIYACEVDTGAPLAPSLAAGQPVEVPFTPNFVDGIGAPFVNQEMFELGRQLVDGSLVVSPEETADAARHILERNRVVPEGAGAVATAAALAGKAGGGNVVSLVSGGNIDTGNLITLFQGGTP
jgi:threonine dehydratase